MKVSCVLDGAAQLTIVSIDGVNWFNIDDLTPGLGLTDTISVLCYEKNKPGDLFKKITNGSGVSSVAISSLKTVIPFQPTAYRDFMLFEEHAINAARGFVKKYIPKLLPVISVYEKLFRQPFPKLKPHKRYYKYPIYYLGNHLNFITHGDSVHIPEYSEELDYELELGVVICKPLKNATPKEVMNAIGGFVVFNDFSARDVQIDEIQCGFGPMKSKNFINAISNIVVTADEILDFIDQLKVTVKVNDQVVAKNSTGGMYYSIAEAIAYASWEEQLHPGEFFGSGTIPQCTGIENGQFLKKGDTIRLEIEKIGYLENTVV